MDRPYQQIDFHEQDGVFRVRFKQCKFSEDALEQLGAEIARLIDEGGCRKMVLSLGPEDLECLYSVFLAKLVNLQRRLEAVGGKLALAEASPNTQEVFRVTGLERYFKFFPDVGSAAQALA